MRPCLFMEKIIKAWKKQQQQKGWGWRERCAKEKASKAQRGLINERATEKGGKRSNLLSVRNVQNSKEVVISESCSEILTSGLSVMQHVGVQRHLMHKRVHGKRTTCPKDAHSYQSFKWKYKSADPIQQVQAFLIYMHVSHTTSHCLEWVCTCTRNPL